MLKDIEQHYNTQVRKDSSLNENILPPFASLVSRPLLTFSVLQQIEMEGPSCLSHSVDTLYSSPLIPNGACPVEVNGSLVPQELGNSQFFDAC